MKKFLKMFIVITLLFSIMIYSITSVFANIEYDDDTIYLTNATYVGIVNNFFGKPTNYEITIYTIDSAFNNYTGHLSTSGKHVIDQDISGIIVDKTVEGKSYLLELDCIFTYNGSSKGFTLELNDAEGTLSGIVNLDIMGLDAKFYGLSNAIKNAEKNSQIKIDEELYNECNNYSVYAYDNDFKNLTSKIPMKLYDLLTKNDYLDISPHNFNDKIEDNVSYVLAHKKVDGKEKIFVIIRGTDGVEWIGNMKICPPDENGNENVYTFNNNTGNTHYNFSKAAEDLEKQLRKYLKDNKLETDNSEIVITGHSRGGAVSNLLAKNLSDDTEFKPYVTAYTFATPNVANYSKTMENYTNIYNFVKGDDLIPCIPLSNNDWNYWKYGLTYIESDTLSSSYCNKLTKLMSSEQYAPTLKNYYDKKFVSKYDISKSISLYDILSKGLGNAMSKDNIKSVKGVLFLIKSLTYNGTSDLLTDIIDNRTKILFGHSYDNYNLLEFSDYEQFNFYKMKVQLGEAEDGTITSLMEYATEDINLTDETTIIYDIAEISNLKSFLYITDNENITNASKLGYDIDDISTWNDITFDSNGKTISIDLDSKNLYGTIDLSNFTNLKNVDLSSNYITAINVSGDTSLLKLDVSDNLLTTIDISSNTALTNFNCSSNEVSVLNFNNNSEIINLAVANCKLSTLNISNLTNLETLNCMINKISTLDFSNNLNLTELYCMLNYIDLTDDTLLNSFYTVESRENSNVIYEPQYIPENALFNNNEMTTIMNFANNNTSLELLNSDGSLNMENIQCYFGFEKINGVFRVTSIDLSYEDVTGELNCNAFEELKEIYTNNSMLTTIVLSDCLNLEKLNCFNCDIYTLLLPSNINESSSKLTKLNCENNHIDINMFSNSIVSNISSKENYVLYYKHQIIEANLSKFNESDYDLMCNLYNINNNDAILNWDLSKPGEWDYINWRYDVVTQKYYILECDFTCLDLTGNIDFSNLLKLENYSFSGNDITTITLPSLNINNTAFYDCKRLEAVIISEGVESIGNNAFEFCTALQAIYIPNSVTSISQNAFDNSPNITIAGISGSYAETYAFENSIPFKVGYFLCGNVVAKENDENLYEYYYPIEDVSINDGNESLALTDKYGYFIVFSLNNGNYTYELSYPYGYDLLLDANISNSSVIISTPIGMINCDWNKDGYINAKDYSIFVNQISGRNTTINDKYFDINNDGLVTDDDWNFAKRFWLYSNNNTIYESYEQATYDIMPSNQFLNSNNQFTEGIEILIGEDF